MAIANTPAVGDALHAEPRRRGSEGESGSRRRAAKKEKKERIHVTLGQRSLELLDWLANTTESSYTQVFRNGLRLYAALIEEAEKGNEFYVKDKDGNFTAYRIFV